MNRFLYNMWILMLILFLLTAAVAAPTKPAERLNLTSSVNQQALENAGSRIEESRQEYTRQLQQTFAMQALHEKMAGQMAGLSRPEIMVPLFLSEFDRNPIERPVSLQKPAATSSQAGGGIMGRVTVNNKLPDPSQTIHVIAFDLHGYYAGGDSVKGAEGRYTIGNLDAGEYYVMTSSRYYVDELYDNVVAPLDNRETWRQAKTVAVPESGNAIEINFDLQSGARISGRIYRENGTTPLQSEDLEFVFTVGDLPLPLYAQTYYTVDGSYSLSVPLTGDVKMSVKSKGYLATWYPGATDWLAATRINIASYESVISNINVTLALDPAVANSGGAAGMIRYNDELSPPFLSAVYAFDLADTSLAGLTLGLLGTYTFDALPQGQYLFFANDILSDFTGGSNYMGQYYQNARTPGQATAVAITPGTVTEGINFSLEKGGVISGQVTNESGAPLDSVLVLAVDAGLGGTGKDPFLTRVAIYLCQADELGRYRLQGLPEGSYIVRTLSDSVLDVEQLGFTLKFKKHQGKYVDEYYCDGQNIMAFQDAVQVPVTVANETAGIDFVLEDGKYITGKVSDAVSGAPVSNVLLFALSDTSGYPFLSLGMLLKKQVKSTGEYRLGPLPTGQFKLLAVAGGLEFKTDYLSEFYDGGRLFDTATSVQLGISDRSNVDFTLDHGAVIQGLVSFSQAGGSIPVGADTLDGFPVMVFNAVSGQLASMDFVQFTGGYRVDHLAPGDYKILALPTLAPFAATYFGGGDSFTDPASQIVTVGYGQVRDCPILLETGQASISGRVQNDQSGAGLPQVMMIAYDPSGHPSGLAMSDMDLATGRVDPAGNGAYSIQGLRPGVYYLRTCALTSAMGLSDQLLGLVDMLGGGLDPLMLIGSINEFSSLFNINFELYQDQWYQTVRAQTQLDFDALLFNLAAYGIPGEYDNALLPIFLPLPMAEKIPAGATAIVITANQAIGGKDFSMHPGEIGDVFTKVEDGELGTPTEFDLSANYPNPFNPDTQWRLSLPTAAKVTAVVYNVAGQVVKNIEQRHMPAGYHLVRWDATDNKGSAVPAGIYLIQLSADGMQKTAKLTLVK